MSSFSDSGGIRRLDAGTPDFSEQLTQLLAWDEHQDHEVDNTVREIIASVRERGDQALVETTNKLDRRSLSSPGQLQIDSEQLKKAEKEVPAEVRDALSLAAARIESFHKHQLQESWSFTDEYGNRLGQRVKPLQRVGVYVPGGKASYPSSVLMNIIPARVAGVEEIVMTVPAPDGELSQAVLAAASIAGADKVFTLGGAQAIAALAYGTELVPRVDKIVGPGNIYVAFAKRQVFGQVGLDMLAGPSEILVICDGQTNPDWIALDLFSQAEHDENAQAILLCPDPSYLDQVAASIERLLPTMPRREIISSALSRRGALIQVRDLEHAAQISNRIAPEHLELSVSDPDALMSSITNAGAIFLGRHTSESLGDYCAGPNHVLPTSATARFSSPLGVYDFVKRSSVIDCSPEGAARLADIATVLADSESLTAHAAAAAARQAQ